jgi:hypothetical protein
VKEEKEIPGFLFFFHSFRDEKNGAVANGQSIGHRSKSLAKGR